LRQQKALASIDVAAMRLCSGAVDAAVAALGPAQAFARAGPMVLIGA
jgi:hypothetical protein